MTNSSAPQLDDLCLRFRTINNRFTGVIALMTRLQANREAKVLPKVLPEMLPKILPKVFHSHTIRDPTRGLLSPAWTSCPKPSAHRVHGHWALLCLQSQVETQLQKLRKDANKIMQQQRKPTLCRTTFENEFYEQFIPRNTLMAVNTFTSTSRSRAKFGQNWKQPYGVVTEGPEVRRSYGPSSTVDTPFCRSTLPPQNQSDSFLS